MDRPCVWNLALIQFLDNQLTAKNYEKKLFMGPTQWWRTKFRSKNISLANPTSLDRSGRYLSETVDEKIRHWGLLEKTLKCNLCGPAHHPTGRNWPAGQKTPWKGPSGPETLLTCIIHHYMSHWATLGSFRHPWGPQNGPKHHPKGPNWPCMPKLNLHGQN